MTLLSSRGEDHIPSWSFSATEYYSRPEIEPIEPTDTGGVKVGPPFNFTYDRGVYVLKLERGKYYVGITHDLERRMNEHFSGNGSLWTQKHHPKEIVETTEVVDDLIKRLEYLEERETIYQMKKHGVDNVRGSDWAHPDLDVCPPLPESFQEESSPDQEKLQEIAKSMT